MSTYARKSRTVEAWQVPNLRSGNGGRGIPDWVTTAFLEGNLRVVENNIQLLRVDGTVVISANELDWLVYSDKHTGIIVMKPSEFSDLYEAVSERG